MRLHQRELQFVFLLAISVFVWGSANADTVLVGWTFPTNNPSLFASEGLAMNTNQALSVEGGAEIVGFVAGNPSSTDAANAEKWDDGEGTKFWLISFSTAGYTNITLSSEQRGSDTGPGNFRAEYRVGDGQWLEVAGSNLALSSSSWAQGRLTNIPLPAAVDDAGGVSIRWIMTSNSSIVGGTVASTGRSRIDNIFIRGSAIPLPPPLEPEVRAATRVQAGQFVANWNAVTGNVAGYELEVSSTDQFLREPSWLIDFEGVTKGNYDPGTLELSGLEWGFTAAMIGLDDLEEERRSLRMRGYEESAFTLLEDLPDGLNRVSFLYRRYGSDTQVDWKVEYSVDQGESWTQIGDDFTAPASDDVQTFSKNVNVSDPARVRIVRASADGNDSKNRRLNIDDIELFGANSDDELVAGYDPFSTTATSVLVEGLDPEIIYYYRVRTVGQDDTVSDWSEVQRAVLQGTVVILR